MWQDRVLGTNGIQHGVDLRGTGLGIVTSMLEMRAVAVVVLVLGRGKCVG